MLSLQCCNAALLHISLVFLCVALLINKGNELSLKEYTQKAGLNNCILGGELSGSVRKRILFLCATFVPFEYCAVYITS